ncbi:MAG TPA: YqjK family protein [Candidatus Paceibacterota bacterium]|nr:YqjK family protein [Candidatus Paceibacterota bacterium]
MPGGKELKQLELRRRELVLESALNRLALRTDMEQIQTALRPAEHAIHFIRAVRPWLPLLTSLARVWLVRRNNGSGFSRIVRIANCIQPLLSLWKRFTFTPAAAGTETPPRGSRHAEISANF